MYNKIYVHCAIHHVMTGYTLFLMKYIIYSTNMEYHIVLHNYLQSYSEIIPTSCEVVKGSLETDRFGSDDLWPSITSSKSAGI